MVQDSFYRGADSLQAALRANYSGIVDSELSLPSDLSGYDAIFMVLPRQPVFFYTLSTRSDSNLVNYFSHGGKFYAECPGLFTSSSSSLWNHIGLDDEAEDGVFDYYDTIYGIDSEFTRGIQIPQAFGEAFEPDTYYPSGNIIPVLLAPEASGGKPLGPVDILAWISSDTSMRVVMHHTITAFYYGEFLTSVLCDYFHLCVDAEVEPAPNFPAITLRAVNDGISTSLVVSSEESGSLDVMSALGVTVYHASVNSGTSRIELPESLRNGVYFARLQTEHGGQVQPFAIVAR